MLAPVHHARATFGVRAVIIRLHARAVAFNPQLPPLVRGSVQQGLSAAGGALGFYTFGRAADKRYSFDGKKLTKHLVEGEKTNKYDKRIIAMIGDAKKVCGYEIANGHRFFCGETCPTDYQKSTRGGIQGNRFIDLKKEIGIVSELAEVAEKLKGKTWG